MKALILLGGLGTRLRPLTCDIPKPLIPLLNSPALHYQIDLIKKNNIKEVIFCTGYLSKLFKSYFPAGKHGGLTVRHVYEDKPLGTGGAIKNAQKYIDDTTVIFNGDILTDIDLGGMIRFHKKKRSLVTVSLVRVKDPTIYGLVETNKESRIERFLEKPSWDEVTCNTINAGTYIFEPEVLHDIPKGINYSLERSLFPFLLEKGRGIYGYVTNTYWLDIGTVAKYLQAHHDILRGDFKQSIYGRFPKRKLFADRSIKMHRSAVIDGRAVIGQRSSVGEFVQLSGLVSIGNKCSIKKGAQIIDSVILDNTTIGEGVRIEKAIVGQNCTIDANAVITPGTVVGNNSRITRFSRI